MALMASPIYRRYVITTTLYGICAVIGLGAMVLFAFSAQWFLTIISFLFAFVALDNFFCGDRCRIAGGTAKSHYVIPPFLKGDKK